MSKLTNQSALFIIIKFTFFCFIKSFKELIKIDVLKNYYVNKKNINFIE